MMDHCAKKAIPNTVSIEVMKNINSDCLTPHINRIKVKLMVTKIKLIILLIILTLAFDLENFKATLFVAFFVMYLKTIYAKITTIVSMICRVYSSILLMFYRCKYKE